MFETLFSLSSSAAALGWLVLIAAPRRPWVITVLRFGVIGALCILYAALVFVHLFAVEGGGFGSIAQVRALFASDGMLVAGWVHYLAFDLFLGTWIAERLDRRGVARLIQAPILVATFLFGPVGLLLALAIEASLAAPPIIRARFAAASLATGTRP
jgi:Domain of unknown function (DUF4281)